MFSQFELLPKKYHDSYLFAFYMPWMIVFSLIVYFDVYNRPIFMMMGVIYLLGEGYFISKIKSGKFEWILGEFSFLVCLVTFFTLI